LDQKKESEQRHGLVEKKEKKKGRRRRREKRPADRRKKGKRTRERKEYQCSARPLKYWTEIDMHMRQFNDCRQSMDP